MKQILQSLLKILKLAGLKLSVSWLAFCIRVKYLRGILATYVKKVRGLRLLEDVHLELILLLLCLISLLPVLKVLLDGSLQA